MRTLTAVGWGDIFPSTAVQVPLTVYIVSVSDSIVSVWGDMAKAKKEREEIVSAFPNLESKITIEPHFVS